MIDNVKNGIIRLEYLRTEDQKADGLTKPFGLKVQEKFRGDLMGKQMHGTVEKKVRQVKGVVSKGNDAREVCCRHERVLTALRWSGYGATRQADDSSPGERDSRKMACSQLSLAKMSVHMLKNISNHFRTADYAMNVFIT